MPLNILSDSRLHLPQNEQSCQLMKTGSAFLYCQQCTNFDAIKYKSLQCMFSNIPKNRLETVGKIYGVWNVIIH